MARSNAERQRAYRERRKAERAGPAPAPPAATPAVQPRDRKGKFAPLAPEEIDRWLEVIAEGYSTRKAAAEVGHSTRTIQEWRNASPENEARYMAAYEAGTQRMEDEAVRRGVFGYEEVTRDGKGKVIRTTHRYDSALHQITLKARRPEKYRENYVTQAQPTVVVIQSAFRDSPAIEVEATEVAELEEKNEPGTA